MQYSRSQDIFPAIHDQGVKKHDIPNNLLAPKESVRFNGSIIRHNGKILLAYRRYHPRSGKTTIAISELRDDFHPLKYYDCDLASKSPDFIQEDCRLFHFNGDLWISYTEIDKGLWDSTNRREIYQCHAKLEFDGVRYYSNETHRPCYGNNIGGVEKNWTYFQHNDSLWACYDPSRQEFIKLNPSGNEMLDTSIGDRLHYPFGYLRGGTPPVWLESEKSFLSFWHGSSQNEWLQRRYYMGAMLIDPLSMTITHVSEKPIVFGSKYELFCGDGNGMCVFPMGAIRNGDLWHVSCGINDTYNAIITIEHSAIFKGLVESKKFLTKAERYFKSIGQLVPYESVWGQTNKWNVIGISGVKGNTGILCTEDPFSIESLLNNTRVIEISKMKYNDEIEIFNKKNVKK
jgi:predicted GH43/DUF377 family glycosyl hydrolase